MKLNSLIILGICMIFLTGCWDRIELNDISIVSGLAVDKGKDKKYRLTIELINASQFSTNKGGGDASPAITYSLEGDSVSELLHKMNFGITRRLIFSHTRVLYISEEVAKAGVLEFLDFLDRSGQFRNDFNIMVTKGEMAGEFTKISYPIQKVPALKVHKQTQSLLEEWGGDPNVRLTDFISAITSKGRNPVAAAIKLTGSSEKGRMTENNQKLDVDALVEMDGMAVFQKEKLIGFLSLQDTRNYLWTQKLKNTSLSVPCSKKESKEENKRFNDVRVTETHAKLKVDTVNGRVILKVKINGETRLEATQCFEDLTKIDTYDKFEKETNQYVKEQLTETIEKVQKEYKSDIFGFGEAYNRQHHKEYKKVEAKWDEIFTQAEVQVNVNLHLRRSGVRGKSFLTEVPKE